MEEYTNRELGILLTQVKEKVFDIHKQTKITNGRVSSLENWKNKVVGALIITEIILLPIAISKLLEIIK